jgi:tRNA(Ile)-lysidine synthase
MTAPPYPPAAALPARVAAHLHDTGLLHGLVRLYLGFSGGPDSTALLLLAVHWGLPVVAVHLHHGLRGAAADADRDWCLACCAARGIPCRWAALDVPACRRPGESTEMAARRLRLAWWRRELAGQPGAALVLGHQADDVLETFLLRLLRGANASGLTGLRPRRVVAGVTLVRPLLPFSRAELVDWLASQGVTDWRRDATNAQPHCRRNRVRHELLPLLRELGGTGGLERSLALLASDAAALEALAEPGPVPLTADRLRQVPPALWPRLLRTWVQRQTGETVPLAAAALDRLPALLAAPPDRPRRLPLSQQHYLRLERGLLYLEPRAAPPPWHLPWRWATTPALRLPTGDLLCARPVAPGAPPPWADGSAAWRTWWPAAALPPELLVRPRRPGDRLTPWGANQPVRVKKLVGSAKVPFDRRTRLVAVTAPSGHLLWVPGLARDGAYPVAADVPATALIEFSFHACSADTSAARLPPADPAGAPPGSPGPGA